MVVVASGRGDSKTVTSRKEGLVYPVASPDA
jgi:hypothetical protein